MTRFRFDNFLLDAGDRQLRRGDVPVELNSRYLDALALLVREQGKLVSKDRFNEEVWRGAPVTDEALTQCIKTLRRQLADNAAAPRFIETVPKHGYRFIAAVEQVDAQSDGAAFWPQPLTAWQQFFMTGAARAVGGCLAGLTGGVFYGFAGASHSLQQGMGAMSVLLVLMCITMLVALIGGAGVGFGIATASFASGPAWLWRTLGGALGGVLVGAIVKMLGLDAFDLLLGQSPGDVTGAFEGALLGGAVGFASWLGLRGAVSLGRGVVLSALVCAVAGVVIPLMGGRLFGGSLDLLTRGFASSRLQLDSIGRLFGETGFGPVSQSVTGGMEAALFGACIVAAMTIARRHGEIYGVTKNRTLADAAKYSEE